MASTKMVGFNRLTKMVVASLLVALPAFVFVRSALAQSHTSTVSDLSGDSGITAGAGAARGVIAPGYLDILGAEVSRPAGTFVFVMTLCEAMPESIADAPDLPGAYLAPGTYRELRWIFPLDTDPSTFPDGPGSIKPRPFELVVRLVWKDGAFSASLEDRRPQLSGLPRVVTDIPFSIEGSKITLTVDAESIGDPPTLGWTAKIQVLEGRTPSKGYVMIDAAPENEELAHW